VSCRRSRIVARLPLAPDELARKVREILEEG
jgi:hypothetical protein